MTTDEHIIEAVYFGALELNSPEDRLAAKMWGKSVNASTRFGTVGVTGRIVIALLAE